MFEKSQAPGRPSRRAAERSAHRALPVPLRAPLAAAATVAAAAVLVMGVLYHGERLPNSVDRWLADALGGPLFAPSPIRTLALVVELSAEPVVAAGLVAALVLLCLVCGRRRLAVLAIAGPGLAVSATQVLKPLVRRTIHGADLAFPSGHTAMLTATGMVVAMLVVSLVGAGRIAGSSLVLLGGAVAGVAMAWSVIVLAMHYPTDTLGGFCTALALVPITAVLIDHVADHAPLRFSHTR